MLGIALALTPTVMARSISSRNAILPRTQPHRYPPQLRFSQSKGTKGEITVTKLLKSILKTAVYILDQADSAAADMRDRVTDQVDRVSDQVSDLTDRGRKAIYGEDHTLRNVLTFAAGLGIGLGAGVLLAPASGEETRSSMRDKVQDIGDKVRDQVRQRFSTSGGPRPTGTDAL